MLKHFKNGVVDGDEFYYYDNRQISYAKHWNNGQEKGKWEYFHPNGQLKIVGSYKDGLRDGSWEYYMENGNKQVFVLYSKCREWMALEHDRFGVPKNNDDVNKYNEMLKNKSDIEAGETKKGRKRLAKRKRKEAKAKQKEAENN